VATATITVTKRNIAEREATILRCRALLKKLPPKSSKRKPVQVTVRRLLTEIAALKASLHYYRPTHELGRAIAQQRLKVKALTEEFKGNKSMALGKQLRKEAKTLNEMLAAAKMQQVQTGINAPLPKKKPVLSLLRKNPDPDFPDGFPDGFPDEEAAALAAEAAGPPEEPEATPAEALDVEEGSVPSGFQPSEFSLEAAHAALAKLEEHVDELDKYTNEEGEVWYKNPVVLVGAGVVAWLVLRRS